MKHKSLFILPLIFTILHSTTPILATESAMPQSTKSSGTVVTAKVTHYCKEAYPHICNNGDWRYTATGTTPTTGRTVAVDKAKIPLGSKIIMGEDDYIAEDVFGTDKNQYRIDILVDTHKEALKKGTYYTKIEIMPL